MPREPGGAASDVIAAGSVTVLNIVLHRAVPRGWEIPANLTAAALMLSVAAASGADLRAYGLDRAGAGRGLRAGLGAGLPLGLIVAAAAFVPQTRRFFRGEMIVRAGAGEAAYHVLLRIPHATAVSEELIFRSALEATLARRRSRVRAALGSAKLFGLWHILPAINRLQSNPGVADTYGGSALGRIGVIAGAVASTAVAGLGFSFLRDRAQSILAPIIVHAAVNAGAFGGGWIAHRMESAKDLSGKAAVA